MNIAHQPGSEPLTIPEQIPNPAVRPVAPPRRPDRKEPVKVPEKVPANRVPAFVRTAPKARSSPYCGLAPSGAHWTPESFVSWSSDDGPPRVRF